MSALEVLHILISSYWFLYLHNVLISTQDSLCFHSFHCRFFFFFLNRLGGISYSSQSFLELIRNCAWITILSKDVMPYASFLILFMCEIIIMLLHISKFLTAIVL